jgi:hypothetical protein
MEVYHYRGRVYETILVDSEAADGQRVALRITGERVTAAIGGTFLGEGDGKEGEGGRRKGGRKEGKNEEGRIEEGTKERRGGREKGRNEGGGRRKRRKEERGRTVCHNRHVVMATNQARLTLSEAPSSPSIQTLTTGATIVCPCIVLS